MGLEVHEMLHILMMQEQRRGKRDERRWYVSSEIAVNDTALKSGFTLPGDADENLKGILPDGKTEGKSVEEIYDLLPTTLKVEIPLHVICLDERTRGEQNEDETGSLQGIPKFISEKELKSMNLRGGSICKNVRKNAGRAGAVCGRHSHAKSELA